MEDPILPDPISSLGDELTHPLNYILTTICVVIFVSVLVVICLHWLTPIIKGLFTQISPCL
jgi:hypothetical protein